MAQSSAGNSQAAEKTHSVPNTEIGGQSAASASGSSPVTSKDSSSV